VSVSRRDFERAIPVTGVTAMAFTKQCQGRVFQGKRHEKNGIDVKVSYDELVVGSNIHVDGEIELPPEHRLLGGGYTLDLKDGESLTIHVTSCKENVAKFYGIR
jgi:hypothetical protein